MLCQSFKASALALAIAMVSHASLSQAATRYAPLTPADQMKTATPIKHLVVIYGENVSFDHYFGTYPQAANPKGVPQFHAKSGTPAVDGLSGQLMTDNGNATNKANGKNAAAPFRLLRAQAASADQNHAYTAEEQAYDNGKADLFPKYTGRGSAGGAGSFGTQGQVMGYYDGNTVTGLWNYAQNYAMSDNAFTDTYGPSTPGALEVVAGQTNGYVPLKMDGVGFKGPITPANKKSYYVNDGQAGYTMVNDIDPSFDICSNKAKGTGYMLGNNIGDLLNAHNISWGGFMAGFNLQTQNANGTTGCKRSTYSDVVKKTSTDYIPHHNWFMYYQSTANYGHTRPSSVDAIGYSTTTDGKTREPANHEYDLNDLVSAINAGNFPAVSYVKLAAFQDAHADYSDPLDEQVGDVQLINFLMQQPEWKNTAVLVVYDDSDGWYDHKYTKPTHASRDAVADQLNGKGLCGKESDRPNGINGKPVNGRCGPGTRVPFLVISPYARQNFVDHTQISQASVVKFIEDNWLNGERLGQGSFDATAGDISKMFDFKHQPTTQPLLLDPQKGTVVSQLPATSKNPNFL